MAPTGASAHGDAESERERVQDQQEEVDARIDVLQASNAEVRAELDRLSGAVADQQAAAEAAQAELVAAQRVEVEAAEALADARHDLELLRQAVEEMAIASYIHPPAEDMVESLAQADFSDALIARTYLDARAKRDVNLLNLYTEAEKVAETRSDEARRAAETAAQAADAASHALTALHSELSRQQAVVADVQVRIDGALAESAALADLDAELAAQIAAEQEALIDALPPEPVAVPVSVAPAVDASGPAETTTSTTPGATSTTSVPSPTTTAPPPPAPPPPPSVTAPPLQTVHGITVHASIADDVRAMIDAARAAGHNLGGSGYRSSQRQAELRIINGCPDVWVSPSWTCRVPTAIPGRSMHERGLAIDITVDGRLLTSRSHPAFGWLQDNAGGYGLYNLPSEPWHWSTTGS